MKTFFSRFFDLRSYDNWNLGAFFLVFVVYAVIDIFTPDDLSTYGIAFTGIVNIAIILYDRKVLNSVFAKAPSAWWLLIMPVYVYRREILNQKSNLHIAHVYLIMMILSVASSFWIDGSRNPDRVAVDACEVIDTIPLYKNANITCVRGYSFVEQYDGFWKGRIHLSNNRIVSVSADYNKEKDYVYVQTLGVMDDY